MGILKMLKKEKVPTFPLSFDVAGLFVRESEAKEVMGKNPALDKARKREGSKIYVLAPFEGYCELVPEKGNKHDADAIKVIVNGHHIGYVPRDTQEHVVPRMKAKQKSSVKLFGGNYRVYEDGEWVTYKGSIKGIVTIG